MLRDSCGGSGNRISLGVALRLLAVLGGAGCGGRAAATGEPGAPLPGLGAAELARFRAGAELFNHVFTPPRAWAPPSTKTSAVPATPHPPAAAWAESGCSKQRGSIGRRAVTSSPRQGERTSGGS